MWGEALAAADDERDPEAPRLSRSGLRALADHAADEPEARAAHSSDRAVGAADLRLRAREPKPDHARDDTALSLRRKVVVAAVVAVAAAVAAVAVAEAAEAAEAEAEAAAVAAVAEAAAVAVVAVAAVAAEVAADA